jgi:hypothetical protein
MLFAEISEMLVFKFKSFLKGFILFQESSHLRLGSSNHGLSFPDESLVLSFERPLGNNTLKSISVKNYLTD